MTTHMPLLQLLLAAILALVLGAATKVWVKQALLLYEPVPIVGKFFRLMRGYDDVEIAGLRWPTFNAAETLLCIAVAAVVVITQLRTMDDPQRTHA
jgi:lipoprotein signal peptidase